MLLNFTLKNVKMINFKLSIFYHTYRHKRWGLRRANADNFLNKFK
jgi:hypothetical protein